MSGNHHATESDVFSETNVAACYQCGKCSAGCPMAEHMDLLPNQLVRLVQMGRIDRAMRAESLWKCVSCVTCSTRCPKSVDCAGVLDVLRQLAFERGAVPDARRRTLLFQKAFLDNVRRNGRVCELELIGVFKTMAFASDWNVLKLMEDATLAPKLMQRRKFHFVGERVKDRGIVKRIFDRCNSMKLDLPSDSENS